MAGIDSYTKLLLHCDGADGSTTFSDDSGNGRTITRSGNTQIDTAQSKFGGASALFDGNGDYLSVADFAELDLGSADFTFDFWVRFNSGGNQNFFSRQDNGSPTSYLYCGYEAATGGIRFRDYNADTINTTWAWTPSTGTWYHIAIIRYSNNVRCYVDGTQIGSAIACSGTFTARTTDLVIGGFTTAYFLNGWLDEFRFSPGIARWTANFTPETVEYSQDVTGINDSLSLNDEWTIAVNPDTQTFADSISLSDSWTQLLLHIFKINTDLRWFNQFVTNIQTSLSWLLAKKVNTDLRWIANVTKSISTDLRWLTNPYTILDPIVSADVQIFINSVDILLGNDIDIQSGNITHTVGNISQASFVLARKHDDLDRTHLSIASQITNQNPIQIYIAGHLEFDGYIMTISVNSESDSVAIVAQMEEPSNNRHTVDIPLPSVNEKLHLYHCLINNTQIDNPKEDTRAVIIGSNGKYWNGTSWVFYIEDAMIFTTDIDAQAYIDAYVDVSITQIFVSKTPSVTTREKNPQYYKGIKVNLGKEIFQKVDKLTQIENIISGKGYYAQQIEDGTYKTKYNFSYFWNVSVRNARTNISTNYRYIGTSLSPLSGDVWILEGASAMRQRIYDNIETELGYYYLGSAPYKEINTKNGRLYPIQKWEDKKDGLYNTTDESYNYIDYAKLIANLEYQKLLNTNGTVLPITSSSIDITFDAYYYYAIKLLTRLNITNTTIANTYKNLNGFPTSVKSININFQTMKITLGTDNKISQTEIDEINAQMPDEESSLYLVPESSVRIYQKYDINNLMFTV
jgi:hypothetical protein